jgi:large subunit ribosomal protein L3
MPVGILGKKIGMTQIFDKNGKMVPVTVIKVEPTFVVQKRVQQVDGYSAIQLGTDAAKKRFTKAREGHCKKAGLGALKVLKEFRNDKIEDLQPGDKISIDTFAIGDFVNITAWSIGKGFQGVIKRHGFHGGPGSHGSTFHRAPGGIGSQAGGRGCRKKVRKGRPLPGQMGNERVTIQNLEVIDVDNVNELLVLKGSIPGGGNNVVEIENSFKKSPKKEWKVIKASDATIEKTKEDEPTAKDEKAPVAEETETPSEK